ncbi:MAG: formyltetrahydrofolate deformylase [Campylobacterales bacterium]
MEKQYRLLIETEDKQGLIHAISGVLLRHNLNIEQNNEFVEKSFNRFFMRTDISGEPDEAALMADLRAVLNDDHRINLVPKKKKRVVVLATKEHHCLGDLLLRHRYEEMDIDIVAVVSNYDTLRDLVENFNIPYHFVTHEGHTRESHEEALLETIAPYNPEYLVLAKYMRILTPRFVGAYSDRIINIHHSFLPAFIGANPYRQAYDRGVKIIGATAHFVNNDLDEGPIIAQSILPVDHTHNAVDMARAGKDVEKQVLAKALRLVFDDRVFIFRNRTIIFES